MRDLTLHEALIRKSLTTYDSTYEGRVGYWNGSGYECESIPLTEEEADEVDRIQALVLCAVCGRVIEDADRRLTHQFRTYCEEHGRQFLAEHPEVVARDA